MQRKSGENLREGLDRRPGQEAWTGGHCGEDTVRPLWDHCGGHCEETTVTGGLHRKLGQEAVDSLEPRFASKRQIGQIKQEAARSRSTPRPPRPGTPCLKCNSKDQTVKRGLEAAIHTVSAEIDATLMSAKNAEEKSKKAMMDVPRLS